MADRMIDYSRFTSAEGGEVVRQIDPRRELRSQGDRERTLDYFQRGQERDGRSEWSGASMGGGAWAGRSRG